MTKSLTILGATGSIGLATLDVVMEANARARAAGQDDAYRVIALTANRDWAGLADQAILTGATFVALSDGRFGPQLEAALAGHKIEIGLGPEALVEHLLIL